MPKLTTLVDHNIGCVRSKETLAELDANGSPQVIDIWTIIITDTQTGDQTRIGFRKEVKNALVSQLTGGIVLAGGELPEL